jgi:hypothetical protein
MDGKEKRENREMKRKREMMALKENLLNRGPQVESQQQERPPPPTYIDRSAMRRRLHPPSPLPAHTPTRTPSPPTTTHTQPAPLSAFAQSMLANQGWAPGQGLGKAGEGRAEPVMVEMRTKGRGLGAQGSKAVDDSAPVGGVNGGDWRSRGRMRRYEEMGGGGAAGK